MCCGRNYIVVEDLYTLLSEEKAKEAFEVFDMNHSGKVSQTEVHDAVLQIFTCASKSAVHWGPGPERNLQTWNDIPVWVVTLRFWKVLCQHVIRNVVALVMIASITSLGCML